MYTIKSRDRFIKLKYYDKKEPSYLALSPFPTFYQTKAEAQSEIDSLNNFLNKKISDIKNDRTEEQLEIDESLIHINDIMTKLLLKLSDTSNSELHNKITKLNQSIKSVHDFVQNDFGYGYKRKLKRFETVKNTAVVVKIQH